MTPQEEQRHIEGAKSDPAAFGPLYEAYFNAVFGFIFKRVRGRDLTGELTSIVFLKALHALPRYEVTGAPFPAWLILSHNKHLNHGHFLVDDRPNNGADRFRGEWVHFGSERFENWEVVTGYLLERK